MSGRQAQQPLVLTLLALPYHTLVFVDHYFSKFYSFLPWLYLWATAGFVNDPHFQSGTRAEYLSRFVLRWLLGTFAPFAVFGPTALILYFAYTHAQATEGTKIAVISSSIAGMVLVYAVFRGLALSARSRSPINYAAYVGNALYAQVDVVALACTLVVSMGLIRIRELIKFMSRTGGPLYIEFVFTQLMFTLIDWLTVPLVLIVRIFTWRWRRLCVRLEASAQEHLKRSMSLDTFQQTTSIHAAIYFRFVVFQEAFHTLADLPFYATALPVLLSLYRAPNLIRRLRECHIADARHVCLSEFVEWLKDLPFIVLGAFASISLIRTVPFIRELADLVRRARPADELRRAAFSQAVMVPMDILTALAFAILTITYYRFRLTMADIREALAVPGHARAAGHLAVWGQFGSLLADLPFILMGAVICCSLWRTYFYLRRIYRNDTTARQRRIRTAKHFGLLLLDIPSACVFLVMCATLWRVPSIVAEFRDYWAHRREREAERLHWRMLRQFRQWIVDATTALPFFVLSVIPFWRIPMVLRDLYRGNYAPVRPAMPAVAPPLDDLRRDLVRYHCVRGYWDVLCAVMSVLVAVSWRMPGAVRQWRTNPDWHDVSFGEFFSLLADIPYAPLALVLIVALWRLPFLKSDIWAEARNDMRRSLVLRHFVLLLCDVPAILAAALVTVTLWHRAKLWRDLRAAGFRNMYLHGIVGLPDTAFSLHGMAFRQLGNLLLDIPFAVCLIPIGIGIWRIGVVRRCLAEAGLTPWQKRGIIAYQSLLALVDIPCALAAILTLVTWRGPRLVRRVRAEANLGDALHGVVFGELVDVLIDCVYILLAVLTLWRLPLVVYRAFRVRDTARQRRSLVTEQLRETGLDAPYAPMAVLLLVAPWRWRALYRDFVRLPLSADRRYMIATHFALMVLDLPTFVAGTIVMVTLWRARTLWRALAVVRAKPNGPAYGGITFSPFVHSAEPHGVVWWQFVELILDIPCLVLMIPIVVGVWRIGQVRQMFADAERLGRSTNWVRYRIFRISMSSIIDIFAAITMVIVLLTWRSVNLVRRIHGSPDLHAQLHAIVFGEARELWIDLCYLLLLPLTLWRMPVVVIRAFRDLATAFARRELIIEQLAQTVRDLPYVVPALLVTLTVWRFPPVFRAIRARATSPVVRGLFAHQAKLVLVDIILAVAFAVLCITWRMPFLVRRLRAAGPRTAGFTLDPWHFVTAREFVHLIKDLPFVPLFALVFVSWHGPGLYRLLRAADSDAQRRNLAAEEAGLLVLDLIFITPMVLMWVLPWRGYFCLRDVLARQPGVTWHRLVVDHIREFFMDCGALLQVAFCVVTLIHGVTLPWRVYAMIREHYAQRRVRRAAQRAAEQGVALIDRLSDDVLMMVLESADPYAVGNFAMTSRKFYRLCQDNTLWRKHLEKQGVPIPTRGREPDYKAMFVGQFGYQRRTLVATGPAADLRNGLRHVINEESHRAGRDIGHTLLLPAKLLGLLTRPAYWWIRVRGFDRDRGANHMLRDMDPLMSEVARTICAREHVTFWNLERLLPAHLLLLWLSFAHDVAVALLYAADVAFRILTPLWMPASGVIIWQGVTLPLVAVACFEVFTAFRGIQIVIFGLRWGLWWLSFVNWDLLVLLAEAMAGLFVFATTHVPPEVVVFLAPAGHAAVGFAKALVIALFNGFAAYADFRILPPATPWLVHIVLAPMWWFCLFQMFTVNQAMMGARLSYLAGSVGRPIYQPLEMYFIIGRWMRRVAIAARERTLRIINMILTALRTVFTAIWNVIRALATRIWSVITFIWDKVLGFFTTVWTMYASILAAATRWCYQHGLLGNILHMGVCLLWMFWSLLIPYFMGSYYILIPTGLFSAFSLLAGWDIVQENWGEPVAEDAEPAMRVTDFRASLPTDTENHGIVFTARGTKHPDFTLDQARLFITGDAFWRSIEETVGASMVSFGKAMFYPVTLCPKMMQKESFVAGQDHCEARIVIATGFHASGKKSGPRVSHETLRKLLNGFKDKGDHEFWLRVEYRNRREPKKGLLFRIKMRPSWLLNYTSPTTSLNFVPRQEG